jgi:uncharacterized protein (TIGR00251 family)
LEFKFIEKVKDGVNISILAQPRSSKSEIAGMHDGCLKVRISSPPVDGHANDALIKFFSKILKVPKSDISIVKGDRSKRKKINIKGADINSITGIIKSYM